ncbi:uncharacterized protein BDZ99DRAFT_526377 [Mytilinidion resinicola]|uniref:Uncharacterized protein n=1 Tax=Mytilinidion resinicola TaxID=574789 RepID=A0A6A6Y6L6_9PEZI|nr:uncharacterized protein BDZ99DRAFT_526377 [Mytilinidion resinicola]KAF2803447.1 hypothetical protein BDZ99DRAFT_526377 [Mytilinidion resinicola]
MSPPSQPAQAHLAEATASREIETSQPQTHQPMQMMQQDPQSEQKTVGMRGGDGRGGACPGRFCFCVPCPLPCDFCII